MIKVKFESNFKHVFDRVLINGLIETPTRVRHFFNDAGNSAAFGVLMFDRFLVFNFTFQFFNPGTQP